MSLTADQTQLLKKFAEMIVEKRETNLELAMINSREAVANPATSANSRELQNYHQGIADNCYVLGNKFEELFTELFAKPQLVEPE